MSGEEREDGEIFKKWTVRNSPAEIFRACPHIIARLNVLVG